MYVCMYVCVCVLGRLYQREVELSCSKNEKFGFGVAVFQGVTNVAINSESTGLL